MSLPLNQLAYQHLQRMLLDEPLPPGSRISEGRLAQKLGISRQPVRDAIHRLSSEGFLYQVPSSGTYVAQPSRLQLVEAYKVRRALESAAVVRAARRPNQAVIARLVGLCDAMIDEAARMRRRQAERLTDEQYRPFLRADMAFHLLLLRAAGNFAAFKIVGDTFLRSQIHGRHPSRRDPAAIARVWALHGNIARAVQQGNAKAARRWLRAHLTESRRDALMTFDRNPRPVAEHRNSPDADVVMDETVEQLLSAATVDNR